MHALLSLMDKKPTYPVGRVNGVRLPPKPNDDDFSDTEEEEEEEAKDDKNYEQEFVEQEMRKYASEAIPQASGFADDMSSIYDFSEISSVAPEGKPEPADIYRRYNFQLNADVRLALPIDSHKEQILSRIELNQITVIEGPTGCGKTTQVPQMIMDSLREKNYYCNIVVTQPRKIATINVAKRVCEERGWTLGTVCGYQVGLEKKISPDQIITYVTTGVLLQKLIHAKCLRQYTHIIIDEVHERNQELDFLLLIVRKFLFTNSPATKVILMSATINANEFAFYFRKQIAGQFLCPPIIEVNKISKFSKTIFFLDQMRAIKPDIPTFDIGKPEIAKDVWKVFIFLVKVFDKMQNNVDGQESDNAGSVLVFLPGINEIEEAHNLLINEEAARNVDSQEEDHVKRLKWEIVPLHSSLPNDEQAQAFRRSKPGYRKIILSTNIAESSVTVPDTRYVIDFCLTKVMTVDPITKYMSLKLEWASHVNCNQRAGRVGRTCDGRVYRLVSKRFYEEEMERTPTPEIIRAPLERIVLHAKMLDLNDTPSQILALAMNPPNLKNIESTIWQLKEIGGLLKTCRGVLSNADGDLTFLGQVMSSLPINVQLSKLIVLGQLFSCLEETIVIAAGCSIQNIFSVPFQKRLEAYKKLLLWADGSCSDLIALLNLFTVWQNLKRENSFANHRQELEWCQRNLVSLKGLKEWQLLITEIKQRLERMNVKETVGPGKVQLSSTEKPTVLKVVMAGAFYPNFFIKTPSPETSQMAEREAVKTVGGRDPFCTVYFRGLEPRQPGQIYVRQIKRMIQERGEGESDIRIGFDGSEKVYVEFKNSTNDPVAINIDGFNRMANIPGRIPRQIYELIRKRQLKFNFDLKVLPLQRAWEFAEAHGARSNSSLPVVNSTPYSARHCFSSVDYSPIPTMNSQFIQITISNPIDAGHFWAQNADAKTNELLQKIDEALNKQVLTQVDEELKVGKIYAARFRDDGLFYRCKLTSTAGRINQILFIDYGNIQEVTAQELFYLPQRPQCLTAPLAFECTLHGVKPTLRQNPFGLWPAKVNADFARWTMGILLYGEIYSVVNDVVELELYRSAVKGKSVNQYMIECGYADPCTPSFLSKHNHEQRVAVQSSSNPPEEALRLTVDHIVSYTDFADPDVRSERCKAVTLKGPYSPLETRVYACMSGGANDGVDIEGTSVNAVLLDTEPESAHSRLLVAAYVGQSAHSNKLRLRQTTLMPNVPGFPMLLAAIFCPTMEAKLTADNSLVAAILCGLGYNEANRKPLYRAHDMILNLDTELKMEELEMINKLRYLMNNGVKLMYEMEQNRSTQNELLATQIKIKDHLFGLINMEREPIDRLNVSPQNTVWGRHRGLGLLKPNLENEEQDIWALLWFVKVARLSQYQKQITKNLEDIENMIYDSIPFEQITCALCQVECLFLHELRRHIISTVHKQAVERYRETLEVGDDDDDDDDDDE